MEVERTIRICDIAVKKRLMRLVIGAALCAIPLSILFYGAKLREVLPVTGTLLVAVGIGTILLKRRGLLVSITLSNQGLSFNYGHLLSGCQTHRTFPWHQILDVDYKPFLSRLTVESTEGTFHVNVPSQTRASIVSLVETVTKKLGTQGKIAKSRSPN